MENKQLSYDALKSVLRHMEANKRLWGRNENTDPDSRFNQSRNDLGGYHIDVDEWGFDRESYGLVRTPGDLVIGDVPETLEENYSDAEMQRLLNEIEENRRDQQHPDPEGDGMYDMRIAVAESELVPYYRRQNNEKPSYDRFIQFSILAKNEKFCSESKPKTFVRVPYNKPLYHAMKYFMDFVFAGRSTVIQVKCLQLGNHDYPIQIIRLPEGIKFNIQQLKGNVENIEEYLKGLAPVLDENSHYSLHGIFADLERVYPNFDEVTFAHYNLGQDVFQNISEWPYLKMNYLLTMRKYQGHEIIGLISNLREMDKRVGTTFKFGFETEEDLLELFNFIAEHFNTNIENRSITLSSNVSKQLHISYEIGIEYTASEAFDIPCILTMEMIASDETDLDQTQ
ncbi:unnamed protein product [Caenorhabditis brenneri]